MNSTIDSESVWPKIGGSGGVRFIDIAEINAISEIPNVVINEVLSDELDLAKSDIIELGWYVTEDNSRKRVEGSFKVMEVVDNDGMATLAGTASPALFTDLTTAQELQKMSGELNTVYYAVDSSHDYEGKIEPVIEQLGLLLNNTLTAQDVGFSLDYQDTASSLTISTDQGLGRISGDKVSALRENLTSLVPQANMLEVLQIPLVELEYKNEQVLSLIHI